MIFYQRKFSRNFRSYEQLDSLVNSNWVNSSSVNSSSVNSNLVNSNLVNSSSVNSSSVNSNLVNSSSVNSNLVNSNLVNSSSVNSSSVNSSSVNSNLVNSSSVNSNLVNRVIKRKLTIAQSSGRVIKRKLTIAQSSGRVISGRVIKRWQFSWQSFCFLNDLVRHFIHWCKKIDLSCLTLKHASKRSVIAWWQLQKLRICRPKEFCCNSSGVYWAPWRTRRWT